jgi:predicted phosphohydrolase
MAANKITIQVFSDIHIESWNKFPQIPIMSKYLFLAGDIGTLYHPYFYNFLDYCSENWEKVFYISGNHEFYLKNKNFNELSFEYKYKLGERYKNVFYLDNEFVSLNDDINVYGSTFWTHPPFISKYEAQLYVNDYNWMSYFDENKGHVVDLDVYYVRQLANNCFNKLQTYLNETNKKTIVMTHFPPLRSETSHPKYLQEKKLINNYFAWPDSTLDKLNLKNIIAWISGHTHWTYDFKKNGTRFISNQIGYKNEIGMTNLNMTGLYEIEIIS